MCPGCPTSDPVWSGSLCAPAWTRWLTWSRRGPFSASSKLRPWPPWFDLLAEKYHGIDCWTRVWARSVFEAEWRTTELYFWTGHIPCPISRESLPAALLCYLRQWEEGKTVWPLRINRGLSKQLSQGRKVQIFLICFGVKLKEFLSHTNPKFFWHFKIKGYWHWYVKKILSSKWVSFLSRWCLN